MKWYLKQLLPLKYTSIFAVGNKKYVAIWKMWLGRSYKSRYFEVSKEVSEESIYQ